jgi:hypothetical protein
VLTLGLERLSGIDQRAVGVSNLGLSAHSRLFVVMLDLP